MNRKDILKELRKEFTCLDYVSHKRVMGRWDDNTSPQFIDSKEFKEFFSQALTEFAMGIVGEDEVWASGDIFKLDTRNELRAEMREDIKK